jgi:hypothetical protein
MSLHRTRVLAREQNKCGRRKNPAKGNTLEVIGDRGGLGQLGWGCLLRVEQERNSMRIEPPSRQDAKIKAGRGLVFRRPFFIRAHLRNPWLKFCFDRGFHGPARMIKNKAFSLASSATWRFNYDLEI